MTSSILVITTGGTIDKVYFDAKSEFTVGESVVARLLQQAHVKIPFEIVELMRKDSLDLTDADRALILRAVRERPEEMVVITHGTDTMTDTAERLRAVAGKTIVLTGALAPARFAESDAVFNVGMAFAVAQSLAAGTYIAMNGQIFRAGEVRKDRASNSFVRLAD